MAGGGRREAAGGAAEGALAAAVQNLQVREEPNYGSGDGSASNRRMRPDRRGRGRGRPAPEGDGGGAGTTRARRSRARVPEHQRPRRRLWRHEATAAAVAARGDGGDHRETSGRSPGSRGRKGKEIQAAAAPHKIVRPPASLRYRKSTATLGADLQRRWPPDPDAVVREGRQEPVTGRGGRRLGSPNVTTPHCNSSKIPTVGISREHSEHRGRPGRAPRHGGGAGRPQVNPVPFLSLKWIQQKG